MKKIKKLSDAEIRKAAVQLYKNVTLAFANNKAESKTIIIQKGKELGIPPASALEMAELGVEAYATKKYYVFRPGGEDEGYVVRLTEAADKVQERLDALEDVDGDPPYYLYEMDYGTATEISELLDEAEAETAAAAKAAGK
jgi:hypothetical protein